MSLCYVQSTASWDEWSRGNSHIRLLRSVVMAELLARVDIPQNQSSCASNQLAPQP